MIEKEKVRYTDDGLEAIIFTAQGDMRQVCAVAAPEAPTSWTCRPSWAYRAPYFRGKREVKAAQSRTRVGNVDPTHRWALGWLRADFQGGSSAKRDGEGPRLKITLDVFVSQQALNNLQSTFSGFGYINSENVFKVQKLAWASQSTKTMFICRGQWGGGGTVLEGRGWTRCR